MFLSAVLLLIAAAEIVGARSLWSDIDPGSGTWTGLANDLAHGTFYRPTRPTDAFDGYGGTRYMPLYFVLDATLIRAGVHPVSAGMAVSLAAGLALLAGTYRAARELGAARNLAACGAILVLASGAVQSGFAATRGDILAAALNVWGAALFLKWDRSTGGVRIDALFFGAVACFVLAFTAKVTTLAGLGACVGWLVLRGRFKTGGLLAGCVAAGVAVLVVAMNAGSGGKMAESFRACASGGTTWAYALSAPRRAVQIMAYYDPAAGITLLAGVACALLTAASLRPSTSRESSGERSSFALANFAVTALATLVIFGSPGTQRNHLMELQTAAALLVVGTIAAGRVAGFSGWAIVSVLSVWGIAQTGIFFSQIHTEFDRQAITAALDDVRGGGPVLCENGIFSVLHGEARPYVIDSFSFALLSRRDPSFGVPMWNALHEHRFAAVVLQYDPTTPIGRTWYRTCNYGPDFASHLLTDYRVTGTHGSYCVLRPR